MAFEIRLPLQKYSHSLGHDNSRWSHLTAADLTVVVKCGGEAAHIRAITMHIYQAVTQLV